MSGMLLDTNVVSALRAPHKQSEPFRNWLQTTDVGTCHISSLTWMGILAGVMKKQQADPNQAAILLSWFTEIHTQFRTRTLAFDTDCATASAPLWLLRPRGSIDTLIAATALCHTLRLVTRNTSDFTDIPHLTVVNPWAE